MKSKKRLKGIVYSNISAWEAISEFMDDSEFSNVFIITDENTLTHCLPTLLQKQNFKKTPHTITIAAGEMHKTIFTCMKVWETLSAKGADRFSLVINLGGGVVTDLGGFVASTFKRGIPFINMPTSLLGMVDASVGGKNGVDLGYIKNQIGVINLPEMVIVDTEFLKTLPSEQMTSGLAEMLKHGIIYNKEYWQRIREVDFSKTEEFENLLLESIEIKNVIVAKDPFEKDLRKTLNYGHTLGHAIESYFLKNPNKTDLLHGEAIAVGLILATYISKEMFNFPAETLNDISTIILKHFTKQTFSENDIEAIINLLVFDKKNRNGQVLFVLLEDIGLPKTNCIVSKSLIYNAFDYYKNF